ALLFTAARAPEFRPQKPQAGSAADCAQDGSVHAPRAPDADSAPKPPVGACAASRSRAEQTEDAVYIMRRNGPPETQMLL
ncbi:MAG: hypothetical protein K2Q06_15675, partial [Parvularculaceae bacterium]|nr:hypothetical protein [Parvularculaceae bacterium]